MASEDEQATSVISQQIAKRIDRIAFQRRRKNCGIRVIVAGEVRSSVRLMVHCAWPGIDDQTLSCVCIRDRSVAQWMIRVVTMFALKLKEVVTCRLFVREVHAPLSIHQIPCLSATPDV